MEAKRYAESAGDVLAPEPEQLGNKLEQRQTRRGVFAGQRVRQTSTSGVRETAATRDVLARTSAVRTVEVKDMIDDIRVHSQCHPGPTPISTTVKKRTLEVEVPRVLQHSLLAMGCSGKTKVYSTN
ncbi:unnamed protein product [Pleuronectes platessa]|uniref:Uncharacterized protein n=1 Tax=Pleuronectes platessa TaxID=8262 RepID=A0A9N7TLS2_PLEPL|nr:unnamed protein product [Pleuronectes platessa]